MPDFALPEKEDWLAGGYTYPELLNADLPEPKWLVPHMIPKPGLIAVTGESGHFKTFFVQWLATRIGAKQPKALFDDWDYPGALKEPVRIVFIEEEMSDVQMKDRSASIDTAEQEHFIWFFSKGFNLKDPQMVTDLRQYLIDNKIDLLIFDPFTSISGMDDENSNAEARKVMDTMRHNFVDDPEVRCSVIFIHHPPKNSPGVIRGAGDIKGKVDLHFVIQKKRDADGNYLENVIMVNCEKTRYKEIIGFEAELVISPTDIYKQIWKYNGSSRDTFNRQIEEMQMKIMNLFAENENRPMLKSEIDDLLGMTKNAKFYKLAWDKMLQKKIVSRKDKNSGFTLKD